MKKTIIVLSSNRPIQDRTRYAIGQMVTLGAAYVSQIGCADVALSRSVALSGACSAARAHPERDTILMVDDDMDFTVDQALELIEHTRETGVPASACYATAAGVLAATAMDPPVYRPPFPGRLTPRRAWLTGLGLLAIPLDALLDLEFNSQEFEMPSPGGGLKTHHAFTSSAAMGGRWYSEDYTLCHRLGGVHLLPVFVGHLKTVPIYPDAESVKKLMEQIK